MITNSHFNHKPHENAIISSVFKKQKQIYAIHALINVNETYFAVIVVLITIRIEVFGYKLGLKPTTKLLEPRIVHGLPNYNMICATSHSLWF